MLSDDHPLSIMSSGKVDDTPYLIDFRSSFRALQTFKSDPTNWEKNEQAGEKKVTSGTFAGDPFEECHANIEEHVFYNKSFSQKLHTWNTREHLIPVIEPIKNHSYRVDRTSKGETFVCNRDIHDSSSSSSGNFNEDPLFLWSVELEGDQEP